MQDDFLKWTWRKLAYVRGAVAALALVTILDGLFGWKRGEFLEFTHALIWHWDHALTIFLSPISKLFPNLTLPPKSTLNFIVLLLMSTPFAISTVKHQSHLFLKVLASVAILMNIFVVILAFIFRPETDNKLVASLPIFSLLLAIVVALFERASAFEYRYARALVSALIFIFTLEALHSVPIVEALTQSFIDRANLDNSSL